MILTLFAATISAVVGSQLKETPPSVTSVMGLALLGPALAFLLAFCVELLATPVKMINDLREEFVRLQRDVENLKPPQFVLSTDQTRLESLLRFSNVLWLQSFGSGDSSEDNFSLAWTNFHNNLSSLAHYEVIADEGLCMAEKAELMYFYEYRQVFRLNVRPKDPDALVRDEVGDELTGHYNELKDEILRLLGRPAED